MIQFLVLFPQPTIPHHYGRIRLADFVLEHPSEAIHRALSMEVRAIKGDLRHQFGSDIDFSQAHLPVEAMTAVDPVTEAQVFRPFTAKEHAAERVLDEILKAER